MALAGDRDAAIADLREAVTLDPRSPRARGQLARQLLGAGRAEEALTEARRMVEANPEDLPTQAMLGLCLAAAGQAPEAREILRKLDDESARRFVSSLDRAHITAGLRDRRATLRYLADAVAAREGFLPILWTYDEFDFLRGDERYAAILKQVGIPEVHGAAQ
jgi:tetratricopeptide (TPR) repeat protein